MMNTARPEWAPAISWVSNLVPGSRHAVELASALEAVRRAACQYNTAGSDHDVYCDCKYGLEVGQNPLRSGERSGCPELREVIHWLLGS